MQLGQTMSLLFLNQMIANLQLPLQSYFYPTAASLGKTKPDLGVPPSPGGVKRRTCIALATW